MARTAKDCFRNAASHGKLHEPASWPSNTVDSGTPTPLPLQVLRTDYPSIAANNVQL